MVISLVFGTKMVILVNTVVYFTVEATDYCKIASDHTMCLYKDMKCGPKCDADAVPLTPSEEDKMAALKIHNDYRSEIAMGKHSNMCPEASDMLELEWDDELFQIAQRWAMQCDYGHDKNREVERFHCGQNAYESSSSQHSYPSQKDAFEKAARSWFSEIKDMNENVITKFGSRANGVIGHFTQMVWANTKYIGCAVQTYTEGATRKAFVVCNYGPSGNYVNMAVYKAGKKCSNCPSGSACSRIYPGLCTTKAGTAKHYTNFYVQVCSKAEVPKL